MSDTNDVALLKMRIGHLIAENATQAARIKNTERELGECRTRLKRYREASENVARVVDEYTRDDLSSALRDSVSMLELVIDEEGA